MKVLIADDHNLFVDALSCMLESHAEIAGVEKASDYASTTRMLRAAPDLDVLLLDLRMPGMEIPAGVSQIREWFPDICIIALSGVANRGEIELCMAHGASGFISKSILGHEIIRAIKSIYSGARATGGQVTFGMTDHSDQSRLRLSSREQSVLNLLHRGMTNKEMAKEIGISPETIKIYVKAISDKLGTRNRTELIVRALEYGLIQRIDGASFTHPDVS
jgi:two-component system, NarL family, nitrate/nitrite response regulator NarL